MTNLLVRGKLQFRHPLSDSVLLMAILVTLMPIVWLIVTAFNLPRSIIMSGWVFTWTWSNFAELFLPGSVVLTQILNSLTIVVGTLVICLMVSAVAGYSLSQLGWSKRTTWILLGSAGLLQLIPPMALVPGLYVTLQSMDLLNSIFGLILLNVVFNLPFATLMMKVYFDSIPDEIREAGLVDGASEFRIFAKLQLPLVRPGLAAVGIFVSIMSWNEFLLGLTLTTGGSSSPVTVGIASLVQPQDVTYGPMAAMGTLTVIPIILLAIIANRQIVAGLTSGAVKS